MIIIKLDIFDGNPVELAVKEHSDAARLQKFCREAGDAFNDQERWVRVSNLMTHEKSGPNFGWTLGMVLPGDDPDQAIDNAVIKESA